MLVLASASARSQEDYASTPVSISRDVMRVGKQVFYAHVVLEKQTLYSISRAYGVTTRDIIDVNPKLRLDEKPLEAGVILLVPRSAGKPAAEPKAKVREKAAKATAAPSPEVFPTQATNVALMLPMADKNYVEYYFGSLMAVKDLAADGLKISLDVLNVSDSLDRTKMAGSAREADVVIGPFHTEDILFLADSLQDYKYIVSPLDPRTAGLCDSMRVILANTPSVEQVRDAAEWCRKGLQDTIIVVSETGGRLTPMVKAMKEQFDTTAERNVLAVDYVFVEGFEMADWFDAHTHFPDTVSRFFICSDRDIFVKDIIRNANVQIGFGKDVEVYGPAKARAGEMSDLCEAHVHASTTFHIDYADSTTQAFIRDYRALFGADPGQFAFHGYDTMKYFVSACAAFGPTFWAEKLEGYVATGLQTDFDFRRRSGGAGFVNEAVRRVLYSYDYKATIVRD